MSNLSPPPKTGNDEFDRWFFLLYKSLSSPGTITPSDDTSVRQVPYGGTGAPSLSGYLRGHGTNPFTAVNQIPINDVAPGYVRETSVASILNASANAIGFSHANTYTAGTVGLALNLFINVKNAPYNAAGDGVTNDTAAIAAANTAYKYLIFPAGTYFIDGALTPAADAVWISEQGAIIKRRTASTATTILNISSGFECRGITFDGNKAANANPCNNVTVLVSGSKFYNCVFINAKVVSGGYGSGVVYAQSALAATDFHILENCLSYSNDTDGFAGQNIRGLTATGNTARNNGGDGFSFNNYDLTFAQKINKITFAGNYAHSNTGSGIVFGNFIQDNSISAPVYGYTNNESSVISVTGNVTTLNAKYGLVVQGISFAVSGNACDANGSGGADFAGLLAQAQYSNISNNTITNNSGFGMDCGWSSNSLIAGNIVYNNTGTGINCGGSTSLSVTNNHLENNGGTSGDQIHCARDELDGSLIGRANRCTNVNISNNDIYLASTQKGIIITDGISGAFVCDNSFFCSSVIVNNCLILIASDATVKGNRLVNAAEVVVSSVTAGGALVVPEIFDHIITNSATTLGQINYYTQQTHVGSGGIGWVDITTAGTGYTANFALIFTGGAGAGAAATAYVDKNGAVVGIRMTSFGTGYTSAPAVSFANGAGASAAGTATLSVPIIPGRNLEIYGFTGFTITRAGAPTVESVAAADIVVAAKGAARLRSFSSRWNLMSKGI